jgi:hypothetical protein
MGSDVFAQFGFTHGSGRKGEGLGIVLLDGELARRIGIMRQGRPLHALFTYTFLYRSLHLYTGQ